MERVAGQVVTTGAFGTINGLNLLLQESADAEIENATYNGWTATHNVSSILVFSPEGLLQRFDL